MSFKIISTGNFEKKLKKLAKKYKSLKSDLIPLFTTLAEKPDSGTHIGNNCYKIRVAISSKSRGKSGGARIITYVVFLNETVYLIDIYDKATKETISDKELKELIALLAD